MIEALFVLFFIVGLGIRVARVIRRTDPRQARLREAQRERDRRTGRFPAEGVPIHEPRLAKEHAADDPALPWEE